MRKQALEKKGLMRLGVSWATAEREMAATSSYQFGRFELNLRSYELKRDGQPLRLEKIPMELLIFLVEHHGELISRDQIIDKLWGKRVFLDSEQGINTAIRKVRQVLQDEPEKPQFLETVVGKGYRFVGDVTVRGEEAPLPRGGRLSPPRIQAGRLRNGRFRLLWAVTGLLITAAVLWVLWPRIGRALRAGPTGSFRSIAVLPLENLSGDPSQEYFADGITDAVITQLAKLRALRVISRTSIMQYKNTHKPLPEIASALNVDAVVEGSVSRSSNRVRVTVQLLDARADRHLWAEEYDRDVRDVLSLQSELAHDVAEQIRASMSSDEQSQMKGRGAVEPAAYESYLRGRSYWNQRTPGGLTQAIAHFEHAIELDPGYAEAYSGLADAYTALGYTSFWSPKDSFPKARELASKALQIDPSLAEARTSLAYAKLYYDWDWKGAEEDFQKAIAVNPNYATAHHWYSVLLTARGRYQEASSEIRRAHELDPLSVPISTDIGFELYYARRYDQAITQLRSVLQTSPKFPLAHLWLGRAYEQKGMYGEAITEFEEAETALKDWPVIIAAAGHAYAAWGHKSDAAASLHRMNELTKEEYVTPYGVALIYAGLNDKDLAVRWLENAYEDKSHWLVWLNLDPRFDNVRSDGRFEELLERMKF
jgi:TolB-like protein/DNA-binding winged helix-turn-helix (wHTH) protein/Tfp pilus assembly protein PilF